MNSGTSSSALGSRLESRVQGFLDRLREQGLRSGLTAGVDLSRALSALPLLDRDAVREACRATVAKSRAELAVVDRVFEEYFGSLDLPVTPPSEEGKLPHSRERLGRTPSGANAPAEGREEVEEELHGRYSPVAPPPVPPRVRLASERLRQYRAGARRFRRSVATLAGRRWRSHPVGSVDLRRTARAGLRSGGEFVELARRNRSPRRADLVILWDVSGSMREHTTNLFGLVYALHRVVRRTRVFAFGHDLEEVTSLLAGRSYERALPLLADRLRPTGGGTRIAHCLTEFRRRHESEVRGTSTLLILSDGWDLGEPNELADQLRRLRGRAYRLVWVNPYAAQARFRPATAALQVAMPYVDLLASPEDFPSPHGPARRARSAVPG
ncbi:MAG TPA: VWA domain-containing protein [Thermoplasmata archaeon]|nr:VWA domain-containing protein [Thermoplasmata archaeon]